MLLQNLQLEFIEAITTNTGKLECALPSENGLIYQQNVLETLIKALKNTYPLLNILLGPDFFRIAAKDYIELYPSCSSNLHDYGAYFSDFLADYPPVTSLVYLPEVATFEWACHTLYFAPTHASFDRKQLETVSPEQFEQLYFMLHPASLLLKFHFPILQIIEICKNTTEETSELAPAKQNLLLIRHEFDISLIPVSESEFVFLTALNENQPISVALSNALEVDAGFKLDEKLPAWIEDKIIVDCFLESHLN